MSNSSHRLVLPAVCFFCLVAVGASAASKTATTAHKGVVPTFTPAPIPQSVYVVPSSPKEGRNPFFPQSVATPTVVKPTPGATVDMAALVLNGITSPPRRTAMINGRTFEPGEEGEVKLPNGAKALIKCEEIGSDSTIIQINGVRRELRLRFGL